MLKSDLEGASPRDRWLFWLLHSHEYSREELDRLFPELEFHQATEALEAISLKSEDKEMYDARQKALIDHQWQLNSAWREGKIELIHTLESLLDIPMTLESDLSIQSLPEFERLAVSLQDRLRDRRST